MTDKELLILIREGDKTAFTRIYHKYYKMLYALAFKYLKNTENSKDATQQTFIKLWMTHKDLNTTGNLRNYLYTITKNIILNQIRNDKIAFIHNYQAAQQINQKQPNLLEEQEQLSILYKAIKKLSKRKQDICLLKINEELTNKQIAENLDISVTTVKNQYEESKKILKKELKNAFLYIITIF